MKILRIGARANHGQREVRLKPKKLRWNPTTRTFDMTFSGAATDFATEARHRYNLHCSAEEFAEQITWLADAGAAMDPEEFADIFSTALPALFRLQAMASGVKLAA